MVSASAWMPILKGESVFAAFGDTVFKNACFRAMTWPISQSMTGAIHLSIYLECSCICLVSDKWHKFPFWKQFHSQSSICVRKHSVSCKSFFAQDGSSSWNCQYDGNKSCTRMEKEGMKEIQKDSMEQEEIKWEIQADVMIKEPERVKEVSELLL